MSQPRPGRPAATSRAEIARCALELFGAAGYELVSVADIAAAAGIARRTFFRYFASKADVFWYQSDLALGEFEQALAGTAPLDPLEAVVVAAFASRAGTLGDRASASAWYRLIDRTPELQAASLRYHRRWVEAIAVFLRGRSGAAAEDPLPEVIAAALLAVGNTVTRHWALSATESDLDATLRRHVALVRSAFEEPFERLLMHSVQ